MGLEYVKWRLRLRNVLQKLILDHRATKTEIELALNSGLEFEE